MNPIESLVVNVAPFAPCNREGVRARAAGMMIEAPKDGGSISRIIDTKEQHGGFSVLAVDAAGNLRTVVKVRFYSSRSRNGSTHYAAVWISTADFHSCGVGRAGGYGYHKDSAALSDALSKAGVKGAYSISGAGSYACEEECAAVALALGCAPVAIITI